MSGQCTTSGSASASSLSLPPERSSARSASYSLMIALSALTNSAGNRVCMHSQRVRVSGSVLCLDLAAASRPDKAAAMPPHSYLVDKLWHADILGPFSNNHASYLGHLAYLDTVDCTKL